MSSWLFFATCRFEDLKRRRPILQEGLCEAAKRGLVGIREDLRSKYIHKSLIGIDTKDGRLLCYTLALFSLPQKALKTRKKKITQRGRAATKIEL